MNYSFLIIPILLLAVSDLFGWGDRDIVYSEEHGHYIVDIEISSIDDLIFMHYEETFPENWDFVNDFTEHDGLSDYIIQGNTLTWYFDNNIQTPFSLSYAIKGPLEQGNLSAIFQGKLEGWDRTTFNKVENSMGGIVELHPLNIIIEGLGSVSSLSEAKWFRPDEIVDLSAIPTERSIFKEWVLSKNSGNFVTSYVTDELSVTIDGPIELVAYFDSFWLVDGENIQIFPDKDFYFDGEVIEVFTEVPYGFELDYWTSNLDQTFGNSNPLSITVLNDINIEPVLKAKEWPAYANRKIEHLENNIYRVSYDVFPNKASSIFAYEELIPEGWEVTSISQGGLFDERNSKVKWGAFYGNEKQNFSFTIKCKETDNFEPYLYADFSIDGLRHQTHGDDTLTLTPGSDNTVVNIQHDTAYDYENGIILERIISPRDSTSVYAYEEFIEEGWGVVDISHHGLFDERNSKIKWGLFFGDEPITITYKLLPEIDNYTEIEPFGIAAFDGIVNSLIDQNDIQPANGAPGTAWAEMRSEFIHTESTPVSISIYPKDSTSVYAVEKDIPKDWDVQNISHEGVFDKINKKIKWGIFTGGEPVVLSYELLPDFSVQGSNDFDGMVSFNGISKEIYGKLELNFGNFSHWFLEHFMSHPHLALPNYDVDGDGLVNMVEYGLGTDPFDNFNHFSYYDVYVENDLFVYELFLHKNDLKLDPLIKFSPLDLNYQNSEIVQINKRPSSTRFEVPLSSYTDNLFIKARITYDPQ